MSTFDRESSTSDDVGQAEEGQNKKGLPQMVKILLIVLLTVAVSTLLSILLYRLIRNLIRKHQERKKLQTQTQLNQPNQSSPVTVPLQQRSEPYLTYRRQQELGLARTNSVFVNPNPQRTQIIIIHPNGLINRRNNDNEDFQFEEEQNSQQNQDERIPQMEQLQQDHQQLWGFNFMNILIRQQLQEQRILEELESHLQQIVHKDRLDYLMSEKTSLINFVPSDHSDSQQSCSICFEDYKAQDELRQVNYCKHLFHHKCLDEWVKRCCERPNCPLCKHEFNL